MTASPRGNIWRVPGAARRAIAIGAACIVVVGATTASLTGAAGPGDDPAKTIPTLPPESVADTVETGSAPESSVPTDPETGIALNAGAGIPEISPVVRAILGETSDVAARIGELAGVPPNIPSPRGADIRGFEITYFGADFYFVATAAFVSNATARDAVTFYQATLTAAGFVPVEMLSEESEPATHTLRFDTPTSPVEDAGVEIVVTEGDAVTIELTIIDAADPNVLRAFTGWAAGLPTLADGEPIEATIQVEADPGRQSRGTLTISTRFGYQQYAAEDLAAEIRAAMPSAPFELDAETDETGSTTISMRHVVLRDVSCVIESGDSHQAVLSLSGTYDF